MPFCTACGRQNPDDARFCSQCGTRLVAPETETTPTPDSVSEGTATITFNREKVDTSDRQLSPVDAAAVDALPAGHALLGPDTGGTYDDLAFALPANAGATYCKRKLPAATEMFGDAAQVWEAQ